MVIQITMKSKMHVLMIGIMAFSVPLFGMDAPAFDPDKDNVESILMTFPWLPTPDLPPPVIDVESYKSLEITVDPTWQKIEEFWIPGVLRRTGYMRDVMVSEGGQTHPEHKKVGHWVEYDQFKYVIFDGTYNANGASIGPHHFLYNHSEISSAHVPENGTFHLHKIIVFGSKSLDPANGLAHEPSLLDAQGDPQIMEEVWYYPSGDLQSVVKNDPAKGHTARDVFGTHIMSFYQPMPVNRQQAFDLNAPVLPQKQGVEKPQLKGVVIQTSGDATNQAVRLSALFGATGKFSEVSSSLIGMNMPNDPRFWKMTFSPSDGLFDGFKWKGAFYLNESRPNDIPMTSLRRIVVWRTAGKMEDGIVAIGFALKSTDNQWHAAGPWSMFDDQGQVAGSGSYKDGKPQGPWLEKKYISVPSPSSGKHTLIEDARGLYQGGSRNGIWTINLFKGNPDLNAVKESNDAHGFIRHITYANGAVTASDENFK